MPEYLDISQVIIDNFIEVLKRIPMKHSDFERIMSLLNLCIEKLGKTITADSIYPYEDSDPTEYEELLITDSEEDFREITDEEFEIFEEKFK